MVHGFLRSVFEALDRHSTSVDIVAISEVSLSFTMETKRLPKALLAEMELIADVTCEDQQAIICLVGEDIHGKPGIAASVFNTIAEAEVNIRMISQGASEINISFVVKESDVPRAVRHLHEYFFPPKGSARSRQDPERQGRAIRQVAETNIAGRRRKNGAAPKKSVRSTNGSNRALVAERKAGIGPGLII
jgi:predicted amino acid-binding ACT domain protein